MEDVDSNSCESRFEDVEQFLITGFYPEYLKNDCGLKSNLRRRASRFSIRDGILHYKHKPHRTSPESEYTRLLSFIIINEEEKIKIIIICNR